MNAVFKTFFSMSFSGGLLILAFLLGKHFLKNQISRQWQYYIWLIVILRLLLPFAPEITLMGNTYQALDLAITGKVSLQHPLSLPDVPDDMPDPFMDFAQNKENVQTPEEEFSAGQSMPNILSIPANHLWLIWLAAALGLLIRKMTAYQDWVRYLKAGAVPVSDMDILNRFSAAAVRAGVQKPVELCVHPLISSPMLIGFFHPCIVLPSVDVSERDFSYIILHELIHYKRRDLLYKWLVQITVCLHWFNPLVHLMSRQIEKACEFSCDEAVLAKAGCENAQDYGQTLLDAMAAVGKYRESPGAISLSENKRMLKERLRAVMQFKQRPAAVRLLTGCMTLCIILGAAFIGIYPVAFADAPVPANDERTSAPHSGQAPPAETLELRGITYYLIQNEAQLRAIGTGAYGMDQNYMQQADIQLSEEEWMPIGTRDDPFTGTFNGNGFEIIGLTMTNPDAEIIGLFGVAENAHIYNVTMRDYSIEDAGRNITGKTVGAILAVGKGVRSYDNSAFPRERSGNLAHENMAHNTADDSLSKIEQVYEAGSIPLFQIAFSRLDRQAQEEWLYKIYADENLAFAAAAFSVLEEDSALLRRLAEQAYGDGDIAFFSSLAAYMDDKTLEVFLEKALAEDEWAFQSLLFKLLDRENEFDEREQQREKEWAEAQKAEYQNVGVTTEGKNYYYQGQLVNIFLDVHANGSFYTLEINPDGTVNIKIVRNEKDEITGVAYISDEEAAELFGA